MSIELFYPYVNFVFKGVFSNSPKALASLIACTQGWSMDKIQSMTYVDRNFARESQEHPLSVINAILNFDDHSKTHIEIQVNPKGSIPTDNLFDIEQYQILSSEQVFWWWNMPYIMMNISLFNLFPNDQRALRSLGFIETQSKEPFPGGPKLTFLELNKTLTTPQSNETLANWMSFFKNPNESRHLLEHDEAFKEAYQELERISQDPSNTVAYQEVLNSIKVAKEQHESSKGVAF